MNGSYKFEGKIKDSAFVMCHEELALWVREVKNNFMTDSDRKKYKECNAENCISIKANLTKIQHFKVEEFFENIFDFFTLQSFIRADCTIGNEGEIMIISHANLL